jgi:hypothetical protein
MSKGYTEIEPPNVQGMHYVYNKAFTRNGCNIWITRDVYHDNNVRWHLSISRSDRYPSWDEIKEARYALLPNEITMAIMLPPQEEYVNLHPNCFHLHEIVE